MLQHFLLEEKLRLEVTTAHKSCKDLLRVQVFVCLIHLLKEGVIYDVTGSYAFGWVDYEALRENANQVLRSELVVLDKLILPISGTNLLIDF